jgi:hypothetical protein
MTNATQSDSVQKNFFVQLIEHEPGIYDKSHPDCDRRHKSVTMQLTEQEPGIYAKRHPDRATRQKLFLCSKLSRIPVYMENATQTALGGTKMFL